MNNSPIVLGLQDPRNPFQRPDQHLLGVAEELEQFARTVREHCAEGRFGKAYTSLYDVLAASQLLVHYLPFFVQVELASEDPDRNASDSVDTTDSVHDGINEPESETTKSVRDASFERIRQQLTVGQISSAYEELDRVLDQVTDAMQAFTFDAMLPVANVDSD